MTGGEWGQTWPPEQGTGPVIDDDRAGRPPSGLSPSEWVKRNLFNSVFNSVLTVVLGVVIAVVAFRALNWVFNTAQWEPVQRNLTLFLQGQFPRDEQWRLVASTILLGAMAGLMAGTIGGSARDRARETGESFEASSPVDLVRRFWPLEAFVLVLLVGSRTFRPWIFVGVVVVTTAAGYAVARLIPKAGRGVGWGLVAIAGFASFQVLSGTGGRAWLGPGLVFAVGAYQATDRLPPLAAPLRFLARLGAVAAALAVARAIYALPFMDFGGVSWSRWGGLHLTLVATVVAIAAAFPIGLVMALGRRSSFPAFRVVTVAYIEFIRGVPLITILLTAQFFIGFFISASTTLDLITRALIGMTLFTAAYIAEIVRGGLLSVPHGQIEAGQALGLSPAKVTRRIVLPQALRAVIPAMVGQFISLFKDTSLLVIIGLTEFLGVREVVHAQIDFRSGFQEMTLVFIAFGYWAISYTMSRESQRLEKRLGVGSR